MIVVDTSALLAVILNDMVGRACKEALAHGCPLLYVGDDFAKTDIESVL